jgi:hypothetical protein
MARTETPAATRDEIRQRLDDEMQGGSPTGLRSPRCRRAINVRPPLDHRYRQSQTPRGARIGH